MKFIEIGHKMYKLVNIVVLVLHKCLYIVPKLVLI